MKFIKVLAFVLLFLLLVTGGISYWIYKSIHTPHTHNKANAYIEIPKGSTPNEIITKLTAEGVLSNEYPTLVYLRTLGDASKLRAGEYQFDSPVTPLQIIAQLEKGEERTTKLTIPEGFTRFDIAKRIAEKFPQTPAVDDKAILAMMDDTSQIKDLDPQAKNLEGYMFPTTYNFPREITPKQIIKAMVDQFRKSWDPEYTQKAQQLGKTPREIVIIGSLLETESKFDDERANVASVIYNRLQKGIPLGIDQTAVYAAKAENRWNGTIYKSTVETDSPYNTRKYAGLPPGPISSVSENAIKAALNPTQTDYIYYILDVTRDDGRQVFFNNAADFERAKVAYQAWLEEQRKIKKGQEAANNQ